VFKAVFKEIIMASKENIRAGVSDGRPAATADQNKGKVDEESLEVPVLALASARNIPRPPTALAVPPRGNVSGFTVSLLGDIEFAPLLNEVERINKAPEGQGRTPLMTVIQAILGKEGGSLSLGDLVAKVRKYWNRPFPASPYTDEEFIYIIVRNSESTRVSG
jgi:hypothetical protein